MGYENQVLTLGAWDDFSQLWLQENYVGIIEDVVREITGEDITVIIEVYDPKTENAHSEQTDGGADANQEEKQIVNISEITPLLQSPKVIRKANERSSVLNPKYTFESFVIGENCNFAHAAAMGVAKDPGKGINPLFIYGGVGLGKTHLLHAIGNRVNETKPDLKVIYISSEKFLNEYVEYMKDNRMEKFRKKYRNIDVLMIDDIQFFAGKERLQEEFHHTFNSLYDAHKQIVLASDRPVHEIQDLETRLVSRFSWGLVVDLKPPGLETRQAILEKKAEMLHMDLPEELRDFLARKIRTNVRELEGSLVRLSSYANLKGVAVSIDVARKALAEMFSRDVEYLVTIDVVQKKVAEFFDVRLADILGKKRLSNIAYPRQVAMYLCRQFTDCSLQLIGEAFGGRDHGTVLHACKVVKDRIEMDESASYAIKQLETIIKTKA